MRRKKMKAILSVLHPDHSWHVSAHSALVDEDVVIFAPVEYLSISSPCASPCLPKHSSLYLTCAERNEDEQEGCRVVITDIFII